jgi:hypothetical protein
MPVQTDGRRRAEFAWPGGDQPGRPEFRYTADPVLAAALRAVLARACPALADPAAQVHALGPPEAGSPIGRYRVTTAGGSWFVRVSARWGKPALEHAIAEHLSRRGVAVSPLVIAGRRLRLDGQACRVDVRPFLEGRHFDGSLEDLRRLASALAQCHRALAEFPDAGDVRAGAARRNARLRAVRTLITRAATREDWSFFAEQADWARRHQAWLQELAEQFNPNWHDQQGAQCLHGEVHPGNVWFRTADGAAVLLDFEESVHVFAPPAWDLAYLVQRFCLRDEPQPGVLGRRLAAVTEGYGETLPRLAPVMRQLAWQAIAVVVHLRHSQGVVTPSAEWDKFVRLEEQARSLHGRL